MYRSHFTNNGHIVAGQDLGACDLDEAITEATRILSERGEREGWEGLEIWAGATLVCQTEQTVRGGDSDDAEQPTGP